MGALLVRPVLALIAAVTVVLLGGGLLTTASGAPGGVVASGYDIHRAAGSPADCNAGFSNPYFAKGDCGFGRVVLAGVPDTAAVVAEFSQGGTSLGTSDATFAAANNDWTFDIVPEPTWPSGPITISMTVDGTPATGTGTVFVNKLGATLEPAPDADGYRPGDPIPVDGEIFEQRGDPSGATQETGVPAAFSLRTIDASGDVRGPFGPFTAAADGAISETLPAAATTGINPGQTTNYRESVRIDVVNATYTQAAPTVPPGGEGEWVADNEPAGSVSVSVTPTDLVLENSFVSAVGWVKPGVTYPFTIRLKNFSAVAKTNTEVTVTAPDSTTLSDPAGPDTSVTNNVLTWTVGTVDPATATGPTVKSLVVGATADTFAQDPQIIWKDLSTAAAVTYNPAPAGPIETESHGPKVIPPEGGYETSRYGDRPFPVVPVDYNDRPHDPASSAAKLATTINDPSEPGSTFNLYQEISYGQLFPNGTVPSDGIASADWEYAPGFAFTENATTDPNSCHGFTNANFPGDAYQTLQPERISDGWYQLPGSTDYYGDDSNGSALIGAVAGVGALQDIDSACGPTGKAVYDAAQIADPEIDYSDYDTDKDGVVDFFMMIFAGVGGHGESQTSVPPYDNIWPHSSDLTGAYTDPATGLTGYVSDDQLRNLEGAPLWYTDATRTQMTTTPGPDELKVWVRVGPYNVNPENSIDKASVISHEYGHSLGLPDYYSTGTRATYGSWTLMATDHSQNMDIVGKKELGWVVPRVLQQPGSLTADDWRDTKLNTHRIDWQEADGDSYTLDGAANNVNNGQGYVAPLPSRQILDPSIVPSGDHVWWSRSGNDFGCTPEAGHNLDIALPGLASVPAGTPVTLTFKSRWDIEWDFDYGFVLATTDNGQTYTSYPSENGYTTAGTQNPQQIACQSRFGNGLTGSSGSYEAGTQEIDRIAGNYPEAPFVDDSYDLSDLAGTAATLRLSYSTDAGLARPGWFIDDLKVTAGSQVLYESDFETANDPAVFNGGCREALQTAQKCTDGWLYASASQGSPAEHAYLMEMRDRSGFDAFGRGESDRGDPTFAPGMLLTYTDENHGYGNFGTDDPPAQSPLDSQPQPGEEAPALDDAAYTAAANDTSFSDSGTGHVDNYADPSRADGLWRFDFGCLGFDVTGMSGDDIGPEDIDPADPATYNLMGDVNFNIGGGCGAFNYGYGLIGGTGKPTAVAQAKPTEVDVGEKVSFDGSASFDDQDAPEDLGHQWDFDGNGKFDANTRQVTHAFKVSGTYEATLRVTDSDGNTDDDSVTITVRASGRCAGVKAKISAGPGKQVLKGTKGRDVFAAFGGNDVVRGRGGNDVICGGGGKDKLFGGSGKDKLKGGKKKDRCRGGPGKDKLRSCEL